MAVLHTLTLWSAIYIRGLSDNVHHLGVETITGMEISSIGFCHGLGPCHSLWMVDTHIFHIILMMKQIHEEWLCQRWSPCIFGKV